MEQFIQLPIKLLAIEGTKKFISALVYAIIDNQKTLTPFEDVVEEPVSFISYNKMVSNYNVRKATAIESVELLKTKGILDYTQEDTGRYNEHLEKNEVFNKYTFPLIKIVKNEPKFTCPFKKVSNSVLKVDLTSKEKGVFLMLHLLTTDTDEIIYNDTEIAKILGIKKKETLVKYINIFINKGLLFKNKVGYTFKAPKQTDSLTITL